MTPTCDTLWSYYIEEYLGYYEVITERSIDFWRHGTINEVILYRNKDDTYWQVVYRFSNDGEINEFREGIADVKQCWPITVNKTEYTTKRKNNE